MKIHPECKDIARAMAVLWPHISDDQKVQFGEIISLDYGMRSIAEIIECLLNFRSDELRVLPDELAELKEDWLHE